MIVQSSSELVKRRLNKKDPSDKIKKLEGELEEKEAESVPSPV